MLGTYHLGALFDILQKIHFIYEPSKLWKFVLEESCNTLKAEAATFYEASESQQELKVRAAVGIDQKRLSEIPFRIGAGLCGWVAQYQQAALVNDVRSDQRFSRSVDMVTGFNTRGVLAVPIFSQKRMYGVLEIINKKNFGMFGPQDQEFMTILGRQVAVAYQNLLFLSEISETKILLQSVLNNLSGGLIAVNQEGLVTLLNPAAKRILELPEDAGLGKPSTTVLKNYAPVLGIIQQTIQSKATVSRQELQLPIGEAVQRVGYTTILISDPEKGVLGGGLIFQVLESK